MQVRENVAAEQCAPMDGAGQAAKRRRLGHSAAVAAVLRDADRYPSEAPVSVREMLALGAEQALAGGGMSGDAIWDQIVALCREALEDVSRCTRQAATAAADEASRAEDLLMVDTETVRAKAAALDEARKALEDAAERLRANETVACAEEAEVGAEEEAMRAVTREIAAVEVDRHNLCEVRTSAFETLVKGTVEDASQEDEEFGSRSHSAASEERVSVLADCLTSIPAEQALVAAMGTALTRPPTARGPFDWEVVEELRLVLAERSAALEVQLQALAAREADAQVSAMGASAVLRRARRRALEASAIVSARRSAVTSAESAMVEAEAAVEKQRESTSHSLVRKVLAEEAILAVAEVLDVIVFAEREAREVSQQHLGAVKEAVASPSEEVAPAEVGVAAPPPKVVTEVVTHSPALQAGA